MPKKILISRELFVSLYFRGGQQAVVEEFGISKRTSVRYANKWGVESPQKRKRREFRDSLKVDYFESWNVNSAYDFGYILADGSISKTSYQLFITSKRADEDLVLDLRGRLGSLHKVIRDEKVDKETGKVYYRTCCSVTSREIVESLERRGIFLRKSKVDHEWPKIPEEFFSHMVRGYGDGDGWSTHINQGRGRQWGLLGVPTAMVQLRELLCERWGLSRLKVIVPKGKPGIRQMSWCSAGDISILRERLYPEGDYPYLKRKRDRLAAKV